jgi:hypothetical protein
MPFLPDWAAISSAIPGRGHESHAGQVEDEVSRRSGGGLGKEGFGLRRGPDVELAQDLDQHGVGADRSCADREAVADYARTR